LAQVDVSAVLADGGRWERWTLDEILDSRVRLLTCEARESIVAEVIALAPQLAGLEEAGPDNGEVATAATAIELKPTQETWTDEIGVIVDEAELTLLLRRRISRGGLPGQRPLREGDVFWVLVPFGTDASWAPTSGLVMRAPGHWVSRAQTPTEVIHAYAEAGAVVLDLTAAARQAIKHIYHRAELAAGAGLKA
jgi:hypothetical protein